jgi:hypothetical protein
MVLKATSAPVWDVPDRAIAISLDVFDNVHFQDNLASFLEQAASERFDRFAAKARKGGKE